MASDNLIEKLIHNLPIKEEKIPALHDELMKVCQAVHPKCGDSCPVYKLNHSQRLNTVVLDGSMGMDQQEQQKCEARESPILMHKFIKDNHLKKLTKTHN